MAEVWTIDGWTLTQGAVRDVESRAGLYAAAPVVGENVTVPNRRGQLWRPKVHGPGGFVLSCWLGGTSRSVFEQYWDDLLRVVSHPERLLTFTRTLAGGSQRICQGEVVGTVAPQPIGQLGARFALEVRVPDGVWRSVADTSYETTGALASPTTITMPPFAGGTAPNDELLWEVTGPATNPKVETVGGLSWWRYAGSVGAGTVLKVDARTWTVSGTGFTPAGESLSWSGARYLTLPVSAPGASPQVVFSASGGITAATKVKATGKVLYLT